MCSLQPVLTTALLLPSWGLICFSLHNCVVISDLGAEARASSLAVLSIAVYTYSSVWSMWPDLTLIYLPDSWSSLGAAERTSWLRQTLSHPDFPPRAAVLYVRTAGFGLYPCCSQAFSSKRSKG